MANPSSPIGLIVGRPSGAPVVRDYLQGDAQAMRFFRRPFGLTASYVEKAAEIDTRFDRAARERAAAALIVPEGADPDRLTRFVEEGGYVVTTGQQPALYGGPLYSIHKALTAVRLAETLESALEKPVLPVFWVASEDHDWEEANHAYAIGVDNELHRFAIDATDPDVHPPIHRVTLGADADQLLEQFRAALPTTDFSAEFVDPLSEAYGAGSTLSAGFHRVMQQILGRFGLFFTDAAHAPLKDASLAVLLSELDRCEAMERVLGATAVDLEATGYGLQVPILEGGVNLFLEGPAGRERLYREEGGFRLRTSGMHLSAEDVRARATEDPSVLSPNVLLRPVVESAVFPTLSYVGGPGEMAYFAQLGDYFEAHGIQMPVVYPRASATPLETKIQKVLDKFGLEPESLQKPFHEVAADIARDEVPADVKQTLGALRGAMAKGVGELDKAVRPIDATLKGPVQQLRSQALAAIDDVEKKILTAIKRQNEISLSQLEKAQIHLFPMGKPAERVQSPYYFLSRYGGAFLDALYERFRVNLD